MDREPAALWEQALEEDKPPRPACTITFLTPAGEFRHAKVGDPLCATLRAEGCVVARIDLGYRPTPWGPELTGTDLGDPANSDTRSAA